MTESRAARSSKARDYPPLAMAGLVMLLMLAALPSALNLPQSNPSQTLEYAPVPPEDENQVDPPAGNLSSLGLGSSRGLGSNLAGDPAGAPESPDALNGRSVKVAGTKRCVGNPPRQTEDPLSPPCVASFRGDNGGATYAGVSRDELRVLIYQGGVCGNPEGYRQPAAGAGSSQDEPLHCGVYHDLDKPPPNGRAQDEHAWTRVMRLYARYFNERYQTYGRHIHFWVYYSKGYTDEIHRAEAAEHVEKVKPFAVVNFIADSESYLETITRHGVMHFLGSGSNVLGGVEDRFFDKAKGLVWGFDPTVEMRAKAMIDWVCKQVVPFPTSFSGNAEYNGTPRRLGLLHYGGDSFDSLHVYARLVKAGAEACGGKFVADLTHDAFCGSGGLCDPQQTHEVENMAEFRRQNVTTIIWPGGNEAGHSRAAGKINYYPEIVIGGDGYNDLTLESQWQDPSVWRNAVAVTAYPLKNPATSTPCYQAAKESDPEAPAIDVRNYGCKIYDALRQLVTGIQVAGPKLAPGPMEKGYRAIPEVRSSDPRVPACFYPDGDYTCSQDFATWWYDPTGDDPESNNPGCNRALEGGLRRLPGQFPREDIPTRRDPAKDPCNPTGLTL